MPIDYNKVRCTIHLDKIRHNYAVLKRAGSAVHPVIKADAYGHGLLEVADALARDGAGTYFVGSVEEAVRLKEHRPDAAVVSLLGPLEREEYDAMVEHGVIPLIMRKGMLRTLAEAAGDRTAEVCLKFDTGMGRLGFTTDEVPGLVAFLKDHKQIKPVMACSHLATADDAESREFVDEQERLFQTFLDFLEKEGFHVQAHLANSAAILAHGRTLHHAQRAGIALYGANPFWGTAWEHFGADLQPAMEVTAPVLQVHDLPRGRTISYGRTFTAEQDMRVAIVGAGYADNYSRALSNVGQMHYAGHRLPIVGRVCMQMTAVDLTPLAMTEATEPRPGDRLHLLGGHGLGEIRPEHLAEWWRSIPYEALCLLGMNPRTYDDGAA